MRRLWIAGTGGFGYIWTLWMSAQYIPMLVAQHGGDASLIGAVVATQPLLAMLVVPLVNRLSDRIKRRKPFMLVGALGGAACLAVAPFVSTPWVVAALSGLFFFGILAESAFLLFLSEQSNDKAAVTVVLCTLGNIGGVLLFVSGSFLLSELGSALGLRGVFVLSAVIFLISFVPPLFAVAERFGGDEHGVVSSLHLRDVTIFCALTTINSFAIFCLERFHALFLREVVGLPDALISQTMLLMTAAGVIGLILQTRMSSRLGTLGVLSLCQVVLAAVAVLFLFHPQQVWAIAASAFLGFLLGGARDLPFTVMNELAPAKAIASAQSRYALAVNVAGLVGGVSMGQLIDRAGGAARGGLGYSAMYGSLAILFMVSALSMWAFRSRLARKAATSSC
jgi:predicted MFS family arabinose efflux permease